MPIKQAGKTIIFEQFANRRYEDKNIPERLDYLLQFKPTQRGIHEIEENLSVASYDEFLKKFNPVIYKQQLMDTGTGAVVFKYTDSEPLSGEYEMIDVTQQQFYKMAISLYEKKGTSGKNNVDFTYDDIKKSLSPESVVAELKSARQLIEYNNQKYLENKEKSPEKAKKFKQCRNKGLEVIKNRLYSKDPLLLLPPLIDDIQRKIDFYDEAEKTREKLGVNTGEAPQLLTCHIGFKDNGDLDIVPMLPDNSDGNDIKMLTDSRQALITLVDHHMEKEAPTLKQNEFIHNAVLSVICGNNTSSLAIPPKNELIAHRDTYVQLYKNYQESFARQMIKVVEKLVNIKAFFDHAGVNGVLRDNEKVLIANCTIKDLCAQDIKNNFIEFINWIGCQNGDGKIWYAVVPAIRKSEYMDEVYDDDDDDDDEYDFSTSFEIKDEDGDSLVTFEDFKEFISLLSDSKIITFFNFKGGEKTGFSSLSKDIVKSYKADCMEIDTNCGDIVSFCYPNFTILPKEEKRSLFCKVSCDAEIKGVILPNKGEKEVYLEVPAIYLDASYIACAIMIAVHNQDNLKSKGFEVNEKYPAVRFDFEGYLNRGREKVLGRNVFTTNMNRETKYTISDEVRSEIKDFGFCFGSDELVFNGNTLKNTYVLSARTLGQVHDRNQRATGEYSPIYMPLVTTFSEMLSKLYNNDFTSFQNEVSEWEYDTNKKYVDNPLYEGDRIEYKLVDGVNCVNFCFGNKVANTGIKFAMTISEENDEN